MCFVDLLIKLNVSLQIMVMCTLFVIYDYEAAVNLLDLIFSIDNKLAYIKVICNTYPPIIRIIAFSGLEKVSISLTRGGARLLPIITKTANGMHV
jgi:hypothetical protein